MSDRTFSPEIDFWLRTGGLVAFVNDWLEEREWEMSPSRGYAFLADLVRWFQAGGIEPTTAPAFDFLVERLSGRSKELTGSSLDYELSMVMDDWRDRELPIPGDPYRSIGQIFDWFLPVLRRLDSIGASVVTRRSTGGEDVTNGEAVDWLFAAVDRLYKDRHFQTRNAWGWSVAYPWADFIRDEIFEFKKKLNASEPLAPPVGGVAFSVPGR